MNHTFWASTYDMTQNPFAAWVTIIAMDVWHWTSLVVLCSAYAGSGLDSRMPIIKPRKLMPHHPVGRVSLHSTAENEDRC